MNKVLNQSALGAIEDADLIIFMLQRNNINTLDQLILKRLKGVKTKKICVINKLDQVASINSLLPVIEKLSEKISSLSTLVKVFSSDLPRYVILNFEKGDKTPKNLDFGFLAPRAITDIRPFSKVNISAITLVLPYGL